MKLITIKRFTSVAEAELALDLLKQAGIKSLLQKDGIPGTTGFMQGADLLIQEKDLENARERLGV